MKRTVYSIWIGFLILVVGCAAMWAQATAQISGTAKDQSGAVLPGVEITVTQTETATTRNAVTNETGSYVLQNLPIGPYRLEASLPVSAHMLKPESFCRLTATRRSMSFWKSAR